MMSAAIRFYEQFGLMPVPDRTLKPGAHCSSCRPTALIVAPIYVSFTGSLVILPRFGGHPC